MSFTFVTVIPFDRDVYGQRSASVRPHLYFTGLQSPYAFLSVLNWGILEDEHTRMSDAGVPLATREFSFETMSSCYAVSDLTLIVTGVEGIPLDSEVLGEGLMRFAYFVESMKRGVRCCTPSLGVLRGRS